MVQQMTHHPLANYVAGRSGLQSSQARIICGWSKNNILTILSEIQSFYKIHYRFRSDNSDNSKGFHIQYSTLELYAGCGGTYSNTSGVLTSPSYPNQYPELADCVYLISQPNGTYVNISFLTMDIDCQGKSSDYIEMRDGNTEESPHQWRFCGDGSNVPDFMQTTQNHLRIRWKKKALRL